MASKKHPGNLHCKRCPNCERANTLKRTDSVEGKPSWRCQLCNVRFVVTNPSYLIDLHIYKSVSSWVIDGRGTVWELDDISHHVPVRGEKISLDGKRFHVTGVELTDSLTKCGVTGRFV